MSNKLRNLFDDSKQEITGKVSFDNSEKYELFVNAIDKAIKEGKPISVDGISNLTISYCDGKSKYPISETNQIAELRIYPYAEMVDVDVLTDQGPKKLKFMRYNQEDKIILDSVDGKGASINISYDEKQKQLKMNYKAHYSKNQTIEEMRDYYNTLFYFCKNMLQYTNEQEEANNILNFFVTSIIFLEEIEVLSKEFGLQINPTQLKDLNNDDLFIERLYFFVAEKKVIRYNQKVNSMNNIEFMSDRRPGNQPMTVSYLEEIKVNFFDNEIVLFVASMAFNLIIEKEEKEEKEENGVSTIYFRESPDNPMYVSRRIFKDKEEALNELARALDNKEEYESAHTIIDYIKEKHKEVTEKKKNMII